MAEAADHFVASLQRIGVQVVVFDMDQTMVRMHSRGKMTPEELPQYLAAVSEDFVNVVPRIRKAGLHLAVATHSDRAEYIRGKTPQTHLIGEDLVWPVLKHAVPEFADDFFVVAYNPFVRRDKAESNIGKRRHMREISEHFGVPLGQTILFDDDANNVSTAKGFRCVAIDPKKGFDLQALGDFTASFQSQ